MNRLRRIVQHIEPVNNAHTKSCMKSYENQSVTLHSYPNGDPLPENFRITKENINILNDGDILLKIECVSIDAYLRTIMYKGKGNLHQTVPLNGKMRSFAIGRVIESNNNNFKIGDYVSGNFKVEKYCVITKNALNRNMVQKIPTNGANATISDVKHYMGILGIATGCSAYAGVEYVTRPIKKDDIIVVNAASGAVGSIVCQLYQNKGGKVIGITGGLNKKEYLLNTLNLYKCIDYKTENIDKKLKEYAPDGINIFFDNVGGEQLDIVLNNLHDNAQIVLCGAVSQYSTNLENNTVYGPKNYINLCGKNAEMKGFTMFEYLDKLNEIQQDLLKMINNGTLIMKEVPIYGLNNFSTAISRLLRGDKNGKILLYP